MLSLTCSLVNVCAIRTPRSASVSHLTFAHPLHTHNASNFFHFSRKAPVFHHSNFLSSLHSPQKYSIYLCHVSCLVTHTLSILIPVFFFYILSFSPPHSGCLSITDFYSLFTLSAALAHSICWIFLRTLKFF